MAALSIPDSQWQDSGKFVYPGTSLNEARPGFRVYGRRLET